MSWFSFKQKSLAERSRSLFLMSNLQCYEKLDAYEHAAILFENVADQIISKDFDVAKITHGLAWDDKPYSDRVFPVNLPVSRGHIYVPIQNDSWRGIHDLISSLNKEFPEIGIHYGLKEVAAIQNTSGMKIYWEVPLENEGSSIHPANFDDYAGIIFQTHFDTSYKNNSLEISFVNSDMLKKTFEADRKALGVSFEPKNVNVYNFKRNK